MVCEKRYPDGPAMPTRTTHRRRAQRPLILLWILVLALTIAAMVTLALMVGPSPPKTITLAGGAPGGAYHDFARRYQKALAAEGVTVTVLDTAGSSENLKLLASHEADVAFVQSGTRHLAEDSKQLRGIASLYYEPLWIFQKGERRIAQLSELSGKRLAIGSDHSGTQAVVVQLLELNGITAQNSVLLPLDMDAAKDALLKGEIDFAFFVASPKAKAVQELMVSPATRVVGIRRSKAYVRNVLFVTDVQIAEGTFDLRQNFPREDIVVLSTLAALVCDKDLHPAIVELLVRTARDQHSGRQLLERGGEFPNPDNLEYSIHEAASDYFQSGPSLLARYMPFWLANLLKKLLVFAIPLLTLLLPLMKIAPSVYKATMRKRIHRHYESLDQIEDASNTAATAEQFDQLKTQLQHLAHQVETGIFVPPTFRNEEYDLRLHVAHVGSQLQEKRRQALGEQP